MLRKYAVAFAFGSLITVSATFASASSPAAPPLRKATLAEALKLAHEHPSLALARARISAARGEAAIPRSEWLPMIGGTFQLFYGTMNNSTGSWIGSPLVDLPRIGATPIRETPSMTPHAATLAAIGVKQTVWDFGKIAARTVAADALVDVARAKEVADRLDVELAVTEAWLSIHAARAVVTASSSAVERATAHRDRVRALVTKELRPSVELARAEADLLRFEAGKLRAEQGVVLARAVFAAAVGVKDAELDADDAPGDTASLPSLETSIARALGSEPTVKVAEANVAAQQAQTEAISSLSRPSLLATATLSGRAGGTQPSAGEVPYGGGLLPIVPNWSIGLVLSIPFFDPVVSARVDAAASVEAVRRAELDVLKQSQRVLVTQVWLEADLAVKAIPAMQAALDAARAARQQATALYASGASTSLDVADAETRELEAEVRLALARFESARARARLDRLMGPLK